MHPPTSLPPVIHRHMDEDFAAPSTGSRRNRLTGRRRRSKGGRVTGTSLGRRPFTNSTDGRHWSTPHERSAESDSSSGSPLNAVTGSGCRKKRIGQRPAVVGASLSMSRPREKETATAIDRHRRRSLLIKCTELTLCLAGMSSLACHAALQKAKEFQISFKHSEQRPVRPGPRLRFHLFGRRRSGRSSGSGRRPISAADLGANKLTQIAEDEACSSRRWQ